MCAVRDGYVLVTGGFKRAKKATSDAQLLDVELALNSGPEPGSANND